MKPDFKKLGEQLYFDGFKIAGEYYDPANHLASLRLAQNELYSNLDDILSGFLNYASLRKNGAECRAGCCWCCYQKIYLLSTEMEILISTLRDKSDPAQLKLLAIHAKRKLGVEAKQPCPFLNLGKCSVYNYRPVACRIYLSSSEKSCLNDFKGNTQVPPALFEIPLQLGRMMNEGFVKGLQKKGVVVEEDIMENLILKSLG